MKRIYWFLPIIIGLFQVVPFILSAFGIFFTPLKNVIQTEVLSEIYMFGFFGLLFVLPAMVLSSYAYLFIARCRFCRQNRVLTSLIFVLTWCLLLPIVVVIAGYCNPANVCITFVIPLFYLIPLVLVTDKVNKELQQF